MPFRYLLVLLTFCLSLLLYIDRACIATSKEAMVAEFGFTDVQWGWAMAIFTLGYALAQTPTGMLADRTGPRLLLGSIVGLWSIMTAVTGMVGGYVQLLVARFVFGATEAGAFPGLARATFSWYPVKERGTCNRDQLFGVAAWWCGSHVPDAVADRASRLARRILHPWWNWHRFRCNLGCHFSK